MREKGKEGERREAEGEEGKVKGRGGDMVYDLTVIDGSRRAR